MFEDCDSLKKEYLVILSVLVTIPLSFDGNPVKTKEKKLFWYCSLPVSHFYECRGVESWEVACQKKVNICPTGLSWGLISDIYFVRLLTPPLFSSPLSLLPLFQNWAISLTLYKPFLSYSSYSVQHMRAQSVHIRAFPVQCSAFLFYTAPCAPCTVWRLWAMLILWIYEQQPYRLYWLVDFLLFQGPVHWSGI